MGDTMPSKPLHLEPSELGTKEYWDSLYTTELTNNTSNPTDRGTVWFDDSDAEAKLLEFLDTQSTEPCSPSLDPLAQATTSFLDLGCGNGSLLFALREEGWEGRCLGVDYSEKSIALAKQIAQSEEKEAVEFAVWDVFRSGYETVLDGAQKDGWDVVLDKGTFDAISLSEEKDSEGRRICEGYKGRIVNLVRTGGLFLVTSCNWTEEELEGWFGESSASVEGGDLVKVGKVNYPSFSFGGVKGQTISTLCFQRR
ncbi:Protein-lysine N-methyltransferase efm4 [Gnomoniopsis smithogilvyi]|uniref:Protein-lysine N-methyltransferase EFM4 n=1 Tax=Gnomoniopsis smithogilvyi TaxID=1191159 RepID=A0A9W8YWS8_9PEZI|nr:Protein-lysine N-methyltransferase efm4 [Gnomoniopsis smithogilvyi]